MITISKSRVCLRVEMLGEFAIISNDRSVTENARKSTKVWRLLQYLAVHRNRSIPQEELLEVFCGESIVGKNPSSVIRTMAYRARTALTKAGIENAGSIIIARSGGYSFSNEIEFTTDVEEFENLITKAELPETAKDKKLELLLQASALYKGDFLPNSVGDMWVVPIARRYRSMYLSAVHDALQLLGEYGRSRDAVELCTKALGIDTFDVKLIKHYIKALLKQGKNAEALDFYQRMEVMFFDVLGVNFSEDLRDLHIEIQKPDVMEEAVLEDILKDWSRDADFPGAYYCDASVFRILYQIEERSRRRSGSSSYIIRFDTKSVPKGIKASGVMSHLGMTIARCLRMGDLFTRYSSSQYMLMLFGLTYEDCKNVIDRIMRAMDSKYLVAIKASHIKQIGEMISESVK